MGGATEIAVGVHVLKFSGQTLRRGFWIYAIGIRSQQRRLPYVGRTGDSSSANAASPFSRISRHLELHPHAKGNTLARNLHAVGIDPVECEMLMIACGPLFEEQHTFESHRPIRDRMAALEAEVARALKQRGYEVIGNHHGAGEADSELVEQVLRLIEVRLMEAVPPNNALQPIVSAVTPRAEHESRQPAGD